MYDESLYELGRNIKMVVCDLDGTLLDSNKQISEANLRAIKKAREKGVFTTICSGRIHQMLYAYSRTLDIQGPLVAANGAVILDTRKGEALYRNMISPEDALSLLRFCEQNEMDYAVLASQGSFFSRGSVRVRRFEQYNRIAAGQGLPTIPLSFFDGGHSDALRDEIHKILIYEVREGQQKAAAEFVGQIPGLAWTSSEERLLDVSAAGVSKGDGVRRLAGIMGLQEREICVFGDYCNDISMMETAGLSIAMGNAHGDVKKAALAVTATNDEDGVALGIEKYILQTDRTETKNENS